MKNIFGYLATSVYCILICACGVNNNISVSTTNGACPNFESNLGSQYCMAVDVLNNSGGQNWINSTSYPITDLTVALTGAGNIQSPATSSSMDPNNCGGSTINPGSSCTFYLKISNESYAVDQQENVQVTLNYTINDTLFGSGGSYSYSFMVYEFTNLYVAQNNGYVWMYNSSGSNTGWVESADVVNSVAVDTSAYGLLYLGGNVGIYQYGASNNAISTSISSGINGSNNLYTNSGNLYATGLSGATGIWSFNLTNESWSSSAVNALSTQTNTNVNALSLSAIPYVAVGAQVFACPNTTTSTSCINEGNALPSTVTAVGFLSSTAAPYTGLYAGTTSGLYIESGTTASSNLAFWSQVNLDNNNAQITSMATTNNTTLFVGDAVGNIWKFLPNAPTTPTLLVNIPGNTSSAIVAMAMDNVGNTLYFTAGSTMAGFTTYSCPLTDDSTCPSVIIPAIGNSNSPIAGMAIGSSLMNTDTPLSDGI